MNDDQKGRRVMPKGFIAVDEKGLGEVRIAIATIAGYREGAWEVSYRGQEERGVVLVQVVGASAREHRLPGMTCAGVDHLIRLSQLLEG